jgi:glycosyltransferase involved in cell wall biosynthesis
MKRLLIITYYWPPTGGSGVQRWVKFSKYLPQFGWQPVIYTPENPEQLAIDESLLSDIPDCAEVIKTHISEPYEIYRRLTGSRGKAQEVNPLNAQKKSLGKKISLWLRGNLFIPDPRIWWVRPSVRFLTKYLREHPVDAVVTTGPPQSMHLIGRGLKRRLGVKWIADFRDPWTEMFYYKHLSLSRFSDRRHHRLEQSVLDEADLVIAVSPPVASDFAAKTKTPVELITNGFDEDDFAAPIGPRSDGKFTLVHTGLFASDGNPLNLWDALAAKCREDSAFRSRLQIRLAGKTDPEIISAIRERGLGDNLVNLGYLPHEQTVAEQRSADILLLPLRQEPEYAKVLPGKIFEYIAARRPVLGIGQSDGAAAAVLRDAGAGEMFGWDEKEALMEFILASHPEPSGAEKYSRRRLTEKLVELL